MGMVSGWIHVETGNESTGLPRDLWMRAVTVRQFGQGMVSGWIPEETDDESTGLHRDLWMRAVTVSQFDGRIGVGYRVI